MSTTGRRDPGADATHMARERERVLRALDGASLSGPAISRLTRQQPSGASALDAGTALSNDQGLLYPALHSLEAGWKLQATWQSDVSGTKHRIYRKRRLLPRRLGWGIRG
jgi:hypothetical protein